MSDSVDIMCARPRASRQASTPRDSCGLDFNMLFDEGVASSSEELRRSHREPCTYMYLRLLRRLCTSENIRMRKVLEVVREALRPLGDDDLRQREFVRRAVQTALEQAGYRPRVVTSRRTSSGNGVLCSQHTYLQLSDSDDDENPPLIVEPLLRDAFQIVRPTEQYQRLLESVPMAFVGTPFRLSALTEFMAARMEESFREQGMSCPPWRQGRSLLAKWELIGSVDSARPTPPSSAVAIRPFNDTAIINFGCGVKTFLQKEHLSNTGRGRELRKETTSQTSGLLRSILACATESKGGYGCISSAAVMSPARVQ